MKADPFPDNAREQTFISRRGLPRTPRDGDTVRPRHGVFSFCVCQGAVLLVSPHYAPDVLELPGGGMDEGETVEQALRREFAEETGLAFPAGTTPAHQGQQLAYFFAEDCGEFWVYTQQFFGFDAPPSLLFEGMKPNPENGHIMWCPLGEETFARMHYFHAQAIRAFLPRHFFATDTRRT